MKDPSQRIVVTGMGVVSSVGIGVNAFHASLVAGRSGITKLTTPWPTGYKALHAGVVTDFGHGVESSTAHSASEMAVVAASEALQSACVEPDPNALSDIGVVGATAFGDASRFEAAWHSTPNGNVTGDWMRIGAIADDVAQALHLQGPIHLLTTTCAAGNHAISWSARLLKAGRAKVMLAFASDTLGFVDILGFCRLLLQAPEKCQPFDRHRKGTLLAEGAGAMVLETAASAQMRGARILAEVLGSGESCDAAGPFASDVNDIRGMCVAYERAIRSAETASEEIEYVNAHGSGTKLNDRKETAFLKAVLGPRAYDVPVSGIKSMLGHAQGAASMLEAVASVLSMQYEYLYPTINYTTPDPTCDLDYIPNRARARRVDTVMSNAFGVGGNNSIVIFRRWSS